MSVLSFIGLVAGLVTGKLIVKAIESKLGL